MAYTPSIGLDQNGEEAFQDKYWGRVPKFIHRIPEQNICEVNMDYITLLALFIDGDINRKNISEELYREFEDFVNKMCNPCLLTNENQAIYIMYEGVIILGLDPSEVVPCPQQRCDFDCDEVLCCNEMLSCECDEPCTVPVVP